jgi:type IX secretion system PorP/SprF family membrane protein
MKKSIAVLLLLSGFLRVHAQVDPHFTQYYAYPLWLNPAFTGVMDGDYRLGMNYRKQLPGAASAFQTQAVSADFSFAKGFGLGLTLFNQKNADASYQYNSGYVSLSYKVKVSEYGVLSSGFQVGLLNRRIDPLHYQFGTQFNPVSGYDPSMPSGESFMANSVSSTDGSLGLLYFDGNPNKDYNFFAGISVYHPTEPNQVFLSGGENNRIPIRYALQTGVRMKMNDQVDLIPHALYMRQGNAAEIAAGLSASVAFATGKDLLLGGTWRLNDAIAPSMGLHLGALTIGFSYDILTSQLKTGSSANGGYELSISFTHFRTAPEARFVCPRL